MNSDANLFPKLRRGRRKGQALNVPEGLSPKEYALRAIFGERWAANKELFELCERAHEYAKGGKPAGRAVNALGRRLLLALGSRPQWLRRAVEVRLSDEFNSYVSRGRNTPIDPVGAALAYLRQKQLDGVVSELMPQHLANYVRSYFDERDLAEDIPTKQTLVSRFIELGGKVNSTRGRKSPSDSLRADSAFRALRENLVG